MAFKDDDNMPRWLKVYLGDKLCCIRGGPLEASIKAGVKRIAYLGCCCEEDDKITQNVLTKWIGEFLVETVKTYISLDDRVVIMERYKFMSVIYENGHTDIASCLAHEAVGEEKPNNWFIMGTNGVSGEKLVPEMLDRAMRLVEVEWGVFTQCYGYGLETKAIAR